MRILPFEKSTNLMRMYIFGKSFVYKKFVFSKNRNFIVFSLNTPLSLYTKNINEICIVISKNERTLFNHKL